MKTIAALIVSTATIAVLVACGQSTDIKGKDQKNVAKGSDVKQPDRASKDARTGGSAGHIAQGSVKTLDLQNGTATLDHGPVQELNWPAKTTTFKVNDKNLLTALQAEENPEFEFIKQGTDYVIIDLK